MNKIIKKIYDLTPSSFQNLILTGYSIFLNKQRYGEEFKYYRNLLTKSQWYSEDEMKEYQLENLKLLIKHAYNTVPYYYKIFKNIRLHPDDITEIDDINKIPLLTRNDIKKNFKELISTDWKNKKLFSGHTSGTTGSPLDLCYDHNVVAITYAALDRMYDWAGVKLAKDGNRISVARGNVIVPISKKTPPFWRYNNYHNQLLLSAFHMSTENLEYYFEELNKFGPEVIDGYPSTLYVLAKYLENTNTRFPIKVVISSSETLYDFQRELIEDRFQTKIFDYYAMAERVIFSTECEKHNGHHFNSEYGIAEIIDKNGVTLNSNETGQLVGTSLHNYAMPLIRYVTDDRTCKLSRKCSCNRGLELMADVTTKAEDIITLADGRLISPSILTHPFKPLNSIEASQIVQEDLKNITIRIIPRPEYSNKDSNLLINELGNRLGNNINIKIEFVENLQRTSRGKFKWVISNVPLGV